MIPHRNITRVAILGSGLIGTDLLVKMQRSSLLECKLFIGRNLNSPGIAKASALGVPVSDKSIDAIVENPDSFDIVFDATSARDHLRHWPILKQLGKRVIDMTPAKAGKMCIPAVNLTECLGEQNVNMVTCGGQASLPLIHLIGKTQQQVEYIEIVSSISSRSAGPATRINIDEYIETTESAIREISDAKRSKVILILNPAVPCIDMQTTIFARVERPDIEPLKLAMETMVARIRSYVPGYQIILGPIVEDGRIVIMVKVQGLGDYLPRYAGNLDIINCAAMAMAEAYARDAIGMARAYEANSA